MSRVEFAPRVKADFDRIIEHLAEFEAANTDSRIGEIIQAMAVLEQNPLIGRPIREDKRELVVGREARGYVALYRYIEEVARTNTTSCWAFMLCAETKRSANTPSVALVVCAPEHG